MLMKLSKLQEARFSKPCYICKKYNKRSVLLNFGATVKCSESKCELNLHVE